jgi:hypothetical protein
MRRAPKGIETMSAFRGVQSSSKYRRGPTQSHLSSRPRDFHPQALLEPCVNLSIHTAPDVRPLP